MAAHMVDIQPLKRALGGNRYLELKEWNGKVLSDVNDGKRCLDPQENVVSDMVSPIYWFFFYDSGKQFVYDVRHVAHGFPLIQM
jgi:hypothetical protein